MNVDRMLAALNDTGLDYLLIGGVNFMLRHDPVLTFDVDVWIRDDEANRARCETALRALAAEWGPTEAEWGPVSALPPGWLLQQELFCLTTAHGALDVFRRVAGLPSWPAARARAVGGKTADGVPYWGLCDLDMLACQEALPEGLRKPERIAFLRRQLEGMS